MSLTVGKPESGDRVTQVISEGIRGRLLPPHLELVPQLNELYELELAFAESQLLSDEQLVRNGAYFARVGDTLTRHFLLCSGEPMRLPQHSSSRLRSFFHTNQFKTGYATHGLFPYRGKFHPQMIKGLMNAMGLLPGDTVLDPMMGSGTVLIEATLMGIRSIGIDASPFCEFMAQAKLDALTVPLEPVREALESYQSVFAHFRDLAGKSASGALGGHSYWHADLFSRSEQPDGTSASSAPLPDQTTPEVYRFLLLAYLDSAGYSLRSDRQPPLVQFRAILERYLFVAEKAQRVLNGMQSDLAESVPMAGDARHLALPDSSIDGIIFSPPYSFAIDYLDNDAPHLRFLGTDLDELRQRMVGLRGGSPRQKYELYLSDMERVLAECARVLRQGRICTIVVGTNNNQLARILGQAPERVQGIDEILVDLASRPGLRPIRKLSRQITGMANTMRTEFIVFLQRT